MSTSIGFTDGTGAASLTNAKPVPADRFTSWVPLPVTVKAESESLATGQPFPFVFSVRQGASFTLDKIPNTSLAVALRLIAWLDAGGVCTVNTGDLSSRSYSSCYQPKGARAQLTLSDARHLEYSLALTLVNTAGTQMLAIY